MKRIKEVVVGESRCEKLSSRSFEMESYKITK